MTLHLLETGHMELPAPAWVFGLIAFGILVVGLLLVRSIGAGRPHSKG